MKKWTAWLIMLFFVLIIQGCKKEMNLEPQDYFEGTQLAIARDIYDGNLPALEKKLAGVDKSILNQKAKAEMTLLFWALSNSIGDKATPERLQIVTALVKAGADPLLPQGNMDGSPAEFVMKGERSVWLKAMLDGGLSPNARDETHNEPIIFQSVFAKNTETLEVMLDYGADINIKNSLGDTLLIDALDYHSYEHVIFLLNHGADSSIRGNSGWTMANQLQRLLNRSKTGSSEHDSLEEIKVCLIKNGGAWPPESVK